MRFVGVDLAWGRRNPTGLCAVEDGAVVESSLARDDDEILAWLRPHVGDGCVVAVDAPLVVRNATGSRPCEKALNRCFGRFHAGCYPSNTTRVPPRAERLAAALDLPVDPFFAAGSQVRRAIEVYPHAALVALFALDRTLKYKARRGRTVECRHGEFARLLGLLESLATADPPLDVRRAPRWHQLAATVTAERVAARLDRAEDELDAYLCAYVALHRWAHGQARSRVVGDTASGYIVTPVTPELARCLDDADPPGRRS
ncbi:MAG TPA: DUF429 domain-containing protein [Egibacteraceae bacterium]|nr:DUF429 domain-containing protein [Egibacteraceae bacterium]